MFGMLARNGLFGRVIECAERIHLLPKEILHILRGSKYALCISLTCRAIDNSLNQNWTIFSAGRDDSPQSGQLSGSARNLRNKT